MLGKSKKHAGGRTADKRKERKRTEKFRNSILKRDKKTCYFCGELGLSLDHLIPIDKGGKTESSNLVCCCDVCNNEKGNMTEEEYRTYCKERETDPEKQKHRKRLEAKLSYVSCSNCPKMTIKRQIKNGLCQSCQEKEKKKK